MEEPQPTKYLKLHGTKEELHEGTLRQRRKLPHA